MQLSTNMNQWFFRSYRHFRLAWIDLSFQRRVRPTLAFLSRLTVAPCSSVGLSVKWKLSPWTAVSWSRHLFLTCGVDTADNASIPFDLATNIWIYFLTIWWNKVGNSNRKLNLCRVLAFMPLNMLKSTSINQMLHAPWYVGSFLISAGFSDWIGARNSGLNVERRPILS